MKKMLPLFMYMRRGKAGKESEGSFTLRLLWATSPNLNSRRIEIGLSTTNPEEAYERAKVFLRGVYALGGQFSNKVRLEDDGKCTTIHELFEKKDSRERKQPPMLPGISPNLPPDQKVDESSQ